MSVLRLSFGNLNLVEHDSCLDKEIFRGMWFWSQRTIQGRKQFGCSLPWIIKACGWDRFQDVSMKDTDTNILENNKITKLETVNLQTYKSYVKRSKELDIVWREECRQLIMFQMSCLRRVGKKPQRAWLSCANEFGNERNGPKKGHNH